MSWRERVVNDGADREEWKAARRMRIGASDAGKYAKASSVEIYVRSKLMPDSFRGNAATESGNRWEPMLLAWAGFDQNKALIQHPTTRGFVATPDGIREDADGVHLAEAKAKHLQILDGPKVHEIRQMAFQLHVVPEAVDVTYVWVELVRDQNNGEWVMRRDPQTLIFDRDHPQIVAATQLIVPIAEQVLAVLDAAPVLEGAF